MSDFREISAPGSLAMLAMEMLADTKIMCDALRERIYSLEIDSKQPFIDFPKRSYYDNLQRLKIKRHTQLLNRFVQIKYRNGYHKIIGWDRTNAKYIIESSNNTQSNIVPFDILN